MRGDYCWPHMAHDFYDVAANCDSCANGRGSLYKHQRYLKLFPAAVPPNFVAMDLLGPFQKTASGHGHILVITDRFSKMIRAVSMKSTTPVAVARTFLGNQVYPYGALVSVLTESGPQFVAKFSEAVCSMRGANITR